MLAWRIGVAATATWQEWLLFLHGGSVGRQVPELGGDLGDYLFRLPFLAVVSAWLRQLLARRLRPHAVRLGGRRRVAMAVEPPDRRRARPAALAHLGLLAALLAAVQALDYVFVRRPMQAVNSSGSFVGAGFTELNVVVRRPGCWRVLAIAAGSPW